MEREPKYEKHEHNHILQGFCENVLNYPDNNAIWVNNCFYTYSELWEKVSVIYRQIELDKTVNKQK